MKVGSLVECVKGFPVSASQGYNVPIPQTLYVIRDIKKKVKGLGLLLDEVVNPKYHYSDGYDEPYFAITSFREVQPPMDLTVLLEETLLQTA